MKKILTALAVVTGVTTPAFAHSSSASPFGTGNVLPFSYQLAVPQHDKIAAGQSGLNAFALASGHGSAVDSNSPATAGGGSRGYNELLRTW
jgi:hypothetical protein